MPKPIEARPGTPKGEQQTIAPGQGEITSPPRTFDYWDAYDDSLVTATITGDRVEFRRQDGRPMWHDGSNTLGREGWDALVQEGFFLRINPTLSPPDAARDILRRTGEDI